MFKDDSAMNSKDFNEMMKHNSLFKPLQAFHSKHKLEDKTI